MGTTGAQRADPLRIAQADLDRAKRWSIGQPVTVAKDDGSLVETVTRSTPWKLGGTWVILVHGVTGGYALARVKER